jgi:hypothetical protein
VLLFGTGIAGGQGVATETKVPATFSGGHVLGRDDYGRPVVLMAAALGVKPEEFRAAFSGVRPAHGRAPTREEQERNKEALMKVLGPLGVTNERMDEVADYYRFRPQMGELWPVKPAKADAIIDGGKIKRIIIRDGGSGYCSEPDVKVDGFPRAKFKAALNYSTDLKHNGAVARVELDTGE